MPLDVTLHPASPQNCYLVEHAARLLASYRYWTGKDLVDGALPPEAAARELYHACFVVLSHDSSADPLLNYANAAGLSLFELSWTELIGMPSRLTAEIPEQDQRARFLTEVSRAGFIANYRGVRIGKTGRRFAIEGATVWNLLAEDGSLCGQAATFDRWTFLEA